MQGNPTILREPSFVVLRAESDRREAKRETGNLWRDGDVCVELRVGEEGVHIELIGHRSPVTHVELHWSQAMPVDGLFLSDHWERSYGDLGWRGMEPDRPMPWYFLLAQGARTYGAGVRTGCAALCWWDAGPQAAVLTLDVRSGGLGIRLGGRRLLAAEVVESVSKEGESAFQFARRFARMLCSDPLLTKEPVYGANNWYYAYGQSSQEQILADTEETSSLCSNSQNRPFSVIDMGWEDVDCREGSHWRRGNARFPNMAGLADRIRDLGARPGIWYLPLLAMESVDPRWTLPFRKSLVGPAETVLDPTVPDVLERIRGDVETMKRWGYELIKHDFSTYDALGRWGFDMVDTITDGSWVFQDRTLTTAEVFLRLYRTIGEAAGGALVMGCNTFGHLCAGNVHLQRIGDDTSGREWERTRKMGVNAFGLSRPSARGVLSRGCRLRGNHRGNPLGVQSAMARIGGCQRHPALRVRAGRHPLGASASGASRRFHAGLPPAASGRAAGLDAHKLPGPLDLREQDSRMGLVQRNRASGGWRTGRGVAGKSPAVPKELRQPRRAQRTATPPSFSMPGGYGRKSQRPCAA